MADNVQKYIDIVGPKEDIARIRKTAKFAISRSLSGHWGDSQLGIFVKWLGGEATHVVDHRGWSRISHIDTNNSKSSLTMHVVTPYGNLAEFMAWLRLRFPDCTFRCYKDDGEGGEEENEFD